MKKLYSGISAFAAIVAVISTAQAGGFALREQSAIGMGMSFAGVAAGSGGLSSMFWNPAISSEYNEYGFISENNINVIYAQNEAVDVLGNESGNIGGLNVFPAGGMSYGLTDKITLGLTTGGPFGSGTNGANDWLGAFYGDKSDVFSINLTPSASYKVNDMLSVGLGIQAQYFSIDVNSRNPFTNTVFQSAEMDDIGFGFTAGVLFEPTETTDIGIGFRSSVKHNLEGEGFLGAPVDTDISAKLALPEMVTLGVRQQVSDSLALTAGVEWTNWSRLEELEVDPLFTQDFAWKDGWFVSLGAEYAYSEKLILRGGVAYERSPVPDETRGVRLPDNDRYWLSVGASYKITESMTANLAYSHVFIKDGDISLADPGLPALVTSFEQSADIISLGITRDW
jgi:long-chain fatty acid transport protein